MNSLLTAFAGFVALCAFASVVTAYRAYKYSRDCAEWMTKNNTRSASLKQMTDIQVELTEHADSIQALHTSLHKLRSRIGMRKLANERASASDDGVPDPNTDPDGYKRAMRAKMFGPKVNSGA